MCVSWVANELFACKEPLEKKGVAPPSPVKHQAYLVVNSPAADAAAAAGRGDVGG